MVNDLVKGKAAWLRLSRIYMGMSAEDVAAELKVNDRVYRRWEDGSVAIPVPVIGEMRDLLDRFDDFVDEIIESGDIRLPVHRRGHRMQAMAAAVALREHPEFEPFYVDGEAVDRWAVKHPDRA